MDFKNNKKKQLSDRQGVSLLMVVLIIGVILVATLAISQIVLRQGRVTKGAEISERAYFAAESGVEKAAYQIFKEQTDITTYNLSGNLTNNATYQVNSSDLTVDVKNPDTGQEITQSQPWQVALSAGQAFSLALDINGATYPATLQIDRSGTQPSDLIIHSWLKVGGGDEQVFVIDFPYDLNINSARFYQIRINNRSAGSETYILKPTSPANAKLPIGLYIKAKGVFFSYQRTVEGNFPRWQKFGI